MFGKYQQKKIKVGDMACEKCVSKITKALKKINNICKVKANLETKEIIIFYKNDLNINDVYEVITNLGYKID